MLSIYKPTIGLILLSMKIDDDKDTFLCGTATTSRSFNDEINHTNNSSNYWIIYTTRL